MVLKWPKIISSYTVWLEKQQSSILSAAAIITTATFVSTLAGLLRNRVIISMFVGPQKDALAAYWVASALPDTVFQLLILGALSAAFIPIFSHYRKKSDADAFRMTVTMMNALLLLFLFFSAIIFIFAVPLTKAVTGRGFSPEQVIIAATLSRIMLGAQFFFAISNFFTGILQSYKRFVIPALAPIIYNLGILAGVYFFHAEFGIYSTGIGVVLGAFLHMLIQLPFVYRVGFRYKPELHLKHPGLRMLLKITPPRMVTVGIEQFQDLADNFFATSITAGEFAQLSVVVISMAQQIMTIPIRFFGVPIAQAALPFLVTEAENKDLNRFRDLLLKSLHQVSFFTFPASVLVLILRVPITRIVYGGTPEFPWQTTLLTGRIIGIIALSIAAQAIVQVLIRAFYALKNTRTPFFITCITVATYVAMNVLFVLQWHWGVVGMAVAITMAAFLELALFLLFLNLRVGRIVCKALWVPQLKMVVASALMAVFLYLPFRILDQLIFNTSRTIELGLLTMVTSTIGMVVYVYFALLFDVRELSILRDLFAKIGGWKKTLGRSQEVILESSVTNDDV